MDLQARIAHTIATADPGNVLSAHDLGIAIVNDLADNAGIYGIDEWDVAAILVPFYDDEENTGVQKNPDEMAAMIVNELDLDDAKETP